MAHENVALTIRVPTFPQPQLLEPAGPTGVDASMFGSSPDGVAKRTIPALRRRMFAHCAENARSSFESTAPQDGASVEGSRRRNLQTRKELICLFLICIELIKIKWCYRSRY